jgi:DNA-binding IclR family transcriptional regulator
MAGRSDQPGTLRSVSNALLILASFSPRKPELGVTELSARLGLGKSTVSRLLSTLQAHGFVSKNPVSGKHRLGVKAYEVGLAYIAGMDLRSRAMPALEALAAAVGETVYLATLSKDGDSAVYIDKILSPQAVRVDSHLGLEVPLHCTGVGKALLAFQPRDVVERFLKGPLPASTPRTIVRSDELRAELARVREQGYALDREEFEEGLHCLGAPIFDHTGAAVASFSISGPAARLSLERMRGLVPDVLSVAASVSTHLGYVSAGSAT